MSSASARPRRRLGVFIGRYFGIEFYLDISWFFIAVFVTYILSTEVFPQVLPHRTKEIYFALGGMCGGAFLSKYPPARVGS